MTKNPTPPTSDQSIAQQQAENATLAANNGHTEQVDPDTDVPGNTADPDAPDPSGDAMYGEGQTDQQGTDR